MSAANLSALSLWGAFLLGLAGGFGHCLAMCGPFVAAASLADGTAVRRGVRAGARRSGVFQLAYHLGRLSTYALIGAFLGLLGRPGRWRSSAGRSRRSRSPLAEARLRARSCSRWASHAGGVDPRSPGEPARADRVGGLAAVVRPRGRRLSRSGGWAGLPLGMLMGLLPCAPLLPVEIAALATGKPLYGVLSCSPSAWDGAGARGLRGCLGLLGARARGWFAPVAAGAVVVLGAVTAGAGARARERAVGAAGDPRRSTACNLCGLPVLGRPIRDREHDFCCEGCRRVCVTAEDAGISELLAPPERNRARRSGPTRPRARPRPRQPRVPDARRCASTACGARRARSCSKTRSWRCPACSTPRRATRRRSRA